jgi:hypothetical protein
VWLGNLVLLASVWLGTSGCKTFSYTEEDFALERQRLQHAFDQGAWRGFGMGFGAIHMSPNLGNISCPGVGGGACVVSGIR